LVRRAGFGAVAEPAADLEQVGTHGNTQGDGRAAEIVKSERRKPGGFSGRDPGALVPIGGLEAPAPRGAEHQGVWLAGEAVPAEMPVEHLGDQTRQRDGVAPGGGLGFGSVACGNRARAARRYQRSKTRQ
jgi:hypothetical protein